MRPVYWMLVALSLVPLCVVVPLAPVKVGIAILLGWTVLLWVVISFVRAQFHYFVLLWVAVYPYCYYFFSYPPEHSIFTVDRAFVVLLTIQMFFVSRHAGMAPLTRDVRMSGYFWALYLLVCFLSIANHPPSEVLTSYRLLVDGMVFPALFGLYAIRYFPLLEDLQKLHFCACILGLGLFISGLIELITGKDLFPWSGADPEFTATYVRRADGPFELHVVLSVVSILTFFLILYLRRLMNQRLSPSRALLHGSAAVASLTAAMIPLDRSLVFALSPIAVIDSFSRTRLLSRRTWAATFAIVLLAAVAARSLEPRLYEERVVSPANFYQRVAQHVETLRVVREYPFFGVGFGLYQEVASQNPRYLASWKGIESMNVPHNALMTVLSENGLVGLFLYVAAQIFLVRAMWSVRRAYPPGWLVFLYCVIIYALTGLDFATVYYSDVNLIYIFILGVILQMQIRVARDQERANGCSLTESV